MRTGKYNGWANWHTWNVMLWINNDEGLYLATEEFASYPQKFTAERVEEFVRELLPSGTHDMRSPEDMSLVDWSEVAWTFNEDYGDSIW